MAQVQIEAVIARGRAALSLITAAVEAATLSQLSFKPGERWSARDTLLHLATSQQEGNRILSYLVKGETPPRQEILPPDQWNRRQMARYADLDAAGALELLKQVRSEHEALAAHITEETLKATLGCVAMEPTHQHCHLHQIREALARARGQVVEAAVHSLLYARAEVLATLDFERRPTAALEWKPAPDKWSVKEVLLHLASWDRYTGTVFAALAEGRALPPIPFPEAEGELDRWNQAQVSACSWMTLAEAVHESGAAHGVLIEQLRRVTAAQWQSEAGRDWHGYRGRDLYQRDMIWKTLSAWQKANPA